MVKKFLFFMALLLLVLSMTTMLSAAETDDDRYVVIDVTGKGKDRNSAIEDAWQKAIHEAAGVFIDSKTELNDNQLTEKIIAYSRALVEKYEILGADESRADQGIYEIKMRLWIVRDVLRDGVKVATNKTAKVSFSKDDLKPKEPELNPSEMEKENVPEKVREKKAATGAELLSAMLDRYKPEDFISVRMVGKVTPVKNSGVEDLCQVVAEVSFNDKYYYEAFVPDLKQVLDQIATKKRDVNLTKQKDTLRRIKDKKGAPLADSSIVMRGNDLGKEYSLAVYDKPDRFGCRLYAFSKDDADKILNNETGILAQFRGRIAAVRGFQVELQDENGEAVDTTEQEITLPFLLTDSVLRDNIWAFHPTLMGYAGMYLGCVPLYRENSSVNIPLRFELPEELQKIVTGIEAAPVLDDSLSKAALDTRRACHQAALTSLTQKPNPSAFESAAEAGYPLAKVARDSALANEIFMTQGLLIDEYVDRLAPFCDAGNLSALYNTARVLEGDAANFENQKKAVPYLTKAATAQPAAMIRMGEVLEQGFYGVKPDKKKADMYYKEGIRILSMLASQGMPAAANELGRVYLEGLGVKQDTPRAERYYQFAEKAGYEDPEFWFWKHYGISMRQVRIPEDFIKNWNDLNFKNSYYRDLERTVPNSSQSPRTCMYLIREKFHSPIMCKFRRYSGMGLVNISTASFFFIAQKSCADDKINFICLRKDGDRRDWQWGFNNYIEFRK